MDENGQVKPKSSNKTNSATLWSILGIWLLVLPFLLILLAFGRQISEWFTAQSPSGKTLGSVMTDKFHVIFGLPAAALFSLLVVSTLRQTVGPLEFKAFGIEFKGASGQVVLWLMCFLAIVLAIKTLW
jgi:hypothetical protein